MRRVLTTLLIVLFLPAAFGWLVLVGAPMSSFTEEFDVTNATDRPLLVTPLGSPAGRPDERAVLPQKWAHSLPAAQMVRHRVLPGETTTIAYDMDDHNQTSLIIENPDGDARIWIIAPPPPGADCYGPPVRHVVITTTGHRSPTADEAALLTGRAAWNGTIQWTAIAIGVGWWILYSIRRRVAPQPENQS